jgi:hypothetical protein
MAEGLKLGASCSEYFRVLSARGHTRAACLPAAGLEGYGCVQSDNPVGVRIVLPMLPHTARGYRCGRRGWPSAAGPCHYRKQAGGLAHAWLLPATSSCPSAAGGCIDCLSSLLWQTHRTLNVECSVTWRWPLGAASSCSHAQRESESLERVACTGTVDVGSSAAGW